MLAYAMLPQLVCTCIGCFKVALVTALGHIFLQEHVSYRQIYGVVTCTVGIALCLCFGPRPNNTDATDGPPETHHSLLNQTQMKVYLACGAAALAALIVAERDAENRVRATLHTSGTLGGVGPTRVHAVTLPLEIALINACQKVFVREVGFLDAADTFAWACFSSVIAGAGIIIFFLNLRAAQRLPVQAFIPTAFACISTLQYFQSMVIFGEIRKLETWKAALSATGALASLVGALCIQPPDLSLYFKQKTEADGDEKHTKTEADGDEKHTETCQKRHNRVLSGEASSAEVTRR